MKQEVCPVLCLLFVALSCSVTHNQSNTTEPSIQTQDNVEQQVNIKIDSIFMQKKGEAVVSIPLSQLALIDYINIFNLDSSKMQLKIANGILTGCIYDLPDYRFYFNFCSSDYIVNFYFLENFDNSSLLNYTICNTRIYHQEEQPAVKFEIETDTLFIH